MKKLLLAVAAAATLAVVGTASANTNLGGATTNPDGSVTLASGTGSAGVDITLPGVTFVGDIQAFSLNYSFPSGCATGVPTLAIITERGTIGIPLSNGSGFTCAPGTNFLYLLNSTTGADTHQLVGGTFLDNWGRAHSEYDNLHVLAVQLLTTGPNQTVTVSNLNLDRSGSADRLDVGARAEFSSHEGGRRGPLRVAS
jgi:hypothetical protein